MTGSNSGSVILDIDWSDADGGAGTQHVFQ